MKKVLVFVGPNGVGKSTTAEAFMQQHARCAYIDSMLVEQ
ncbi:MAG: ATP-binding protein [Lachnospiraceae bacterium]|nr:ATP-binding protein [Lachnospiraceae bacterium]